MSKEQPFSAESVISAYVDDLLSAPEDQDPYIDHWPRSHAAPLPGPAALSQEKATPRVLLAERPALAPVVFPPIPLATPEPPPAPAPPVSASPSALQSPPQSPLQSPPQPAAKAPVAEPVAAEVAAASATAAEQPQSEEWLQGRPPWAQKGFECLIFQVAGLQLAVPLVLLGAIHRLDTELTPLFGRPDWFMGLLREGNQTINVADTGRWVMPERYRNTALAKTAGDYQFVIRLDDSHWGLACHEVAQSFTVQPEDVKWRTANSRRQWLAGTVREHMCALLDVSRLARMLSEAEQGRPLDMNG